MAEPGGQQKPPMPDMSSMWRMLIIMVLILGLYWIDQSFGEKYVDGNGHLIGRVLDYVFCFLDFGGKWPVVTLMLMGAIMIILSSGIRTLMTDTLEQQKAAAFSAAFNKELRQARIENNLYKQKKLMELQPVMMEKSMESSNQMMKSMPYTMLVVVPIFLWVRYFVNVTLVTIDGASQIINIPWAMDVALGGTGGISLIANIWFMPAWILIYSLISIPIGQIIMRGVRYFQFKKRLAEIEAENASQEAA